MNNRKLPTEPHKAVTANALFRQLLWIALLYASIATLGGSPLLALGANWTARQLSFLVATLPMISLIILAVDGVTLAYIYRPVRAGLEAIESGRDEPILVQQALIQTLNLPLLTFARVMVAHGPTGIISAVCAMIYLNINFDTDFQTREFIVPLLLGLTTVVTAHAILEYFAVLKTVRPVIPFIRQHAGTLPPDLQDRIVPINIRQRLLFITVSMTFIPVVALGVSVVETIDRSDYARTAADDDFVDACEEFISAVDQTFADRYPAWFDRKAGGQRRTDQCVHANPTSASRIRVIWVPFGRTNPRSIDQTRQARSSSPSD